MRRILLWAGGIVFWLAWPFWFVYFKLNPRRSRLLVVSGGDVLLIRNWLSSGKWGLPGGGAKSQESLAASAVRELHEEVGISASETDLKPMGSRQHRQFGLGYHAEYYLLELTERPVLRIRTLEIAEAIWVPVAGASNLQLDEDAAHALGYYQST